MKRNLLLLLSFFMLSFGANAQVSITGVGGPLGDWGDGFDYDLTSSDGLHWTASGVTMLGGEFKFRFNHAWTINWGGAGFPSGTGSQDGPNIVAVAGTYDVTVDFSADPASGTATATWTFSGGAPIAVVNLIGPATSGPVAFSTTDGIMYSASNVTLTDGGAQFEVDGAAFGGTTFPDGQVSDPSAFIPVVGGTYSTISFNNSDGTYSFTAAPVFPVISITGSAVGGWGDGFDFDMTTTDGVNYHYYGLPATTVGELKFRQDHAWTTSYGDVGFPSGTATTTGGNIPVNATGGYDVMFNLTSGEYTFSVPVISLTGSAFGGWGDGFDFDLSTNDNGITYTLASITATTTGEGKFRFNHAWDISYGSSEFPVGTSSTSGGNIQIPAGTYGVTFNHTTGGFTFGEPLATASFTNANGFRVYPNPTSNTWNFSAASNEKIASVRIVDMLGKTVLNVNVDATSASVDAASLNAGVYFAKVATASGETTVKVVKN